MFTPSIYAIDFGTSNSLLAAANSNEISAPIPLDPSSEDPTVLRSILFFPSIGRIFYGREAITQYVEHGMQGRLIRSIKKHLSSTGFRGTHIDNQLLRIEDLVGVILREMKLRADRYFGADVRRVVLGRPAKYSSNEEADRVAQGRMVRAAEFAGFAEIHFCPEPVAAARSFSHELAEEQMVLVADFGGGTSDFTLLKLRRDDYRDEDVLALGGISVAGDALDSAIMRTEIAPHFGANVEYRVPGGGNVMRMPKSIMERICSPADASLLHDRDAQTLLRSIRAWSVGEKDRERIDRLFTFVEDALGFQVFERIEESKRALSHGHETRFTFSYPTIEIEETISRVRFERSSDRLVGQIIAELDAVVARSGLRYDDIDLVCATGGTAKVPRLAALLAERFGTERIREFRHFHSVIGGLADAAHDWARR